MLNGDFLDMLNGDCLCAIVKIPLVHRLRFRRLIHHCNERERSPRHVIVRDNDDVSISLVEVGS
jgi:hypothetical protein